MIHSHHAAIVAQRAYPVHPEDADDLDEDLARAAVVAPRPLGHRYGK
jgi:hypothetical protein